MLCGRDGCNPWLPLGISQMFQKSAVDFRACGKSASRKSRADIDAVSATRLRRVDAMHRRREISGGKPVIRPACIETR
jgi:hypothetical protein